MHEHGSNPDGEQLQIEFLDQPIDAENLITGTPSLTESQNNLIDTPAQADPRLLRMLESAQNYAIVETEQPPQQRSRIRHMLGTLSLRRLVENSFQAAVKQPLMSVEILTTNARIKGRKYEERERLDEFAAELGIDRQRTSQQEKKDSTIAEWNKTHAAINDLPSAIRKPRIYSVGEAVGLAQASFNERVDELAHEEHERLFESPYKRFHSPALDEAKVRGDVAAYRKELRRLAAEDGAFSKRDIIKAKYGRDMDAEEEEKKRLELARAREAARLRLEVTAQRSRRITEAAPLSDAPVGGQRKSTHKPIINVSEIDPAYIRYFDQELLAEMDLMISEAIREEARKRREASAVDRLPEEEFRELTKSVRTAVIWDYVGLGAPNEVVARLERALYELTEERNRIPKSE